MEFPPPEKGDIAVKRPSLLTSLAAACRTTRVSRRQLVILFVVVAAVTVGGLPAGGGRRIKQPAADQPSVWAVFSSSA